MESKVAVGVAAGFGAAVALFLMWGRLRIVLVKDDGSVRVPARLVGPGRLVAQVVDCHCGGLPARVVVGGAPTEEIEVGSCGERREILKTKFDWFRKIMLTEPRGYPCQNVDIVYPPTPACPDAEFSYVIGENAGIYPMMSGHNTICVCTALLETGMIPMQEGVTKFSLEAPAGRISVTAVCKEGKAESITFRNTKCFVGPRDLKIRVPTISRPVAVDLAYGGMWYAIVDLEDPHNRNIPELAKIATLQPEQGGEIVRLGEMIKVATREQHPVHHPEVEDQGPTIMVFRCKPSRESQVHKGVSARNAVVMSTGKLDWNRPETWKGNIDRSPCGTGTCAVMALLHAKGELALNQSFTHESVVGSVFVGKIVSLSTVGSGDKKIPAIIPTITGSAVITQFSQVVLDPTDPFPDGFTVGDIWA